MARHLFPLNDVLIGVPSTGLVAGVPALLTHGTVLDLYADLACTTPLDARDAGNVGAITSTTVNGCQVPAFLGPNDDSVWAVYARRHGDSGNGIPLYRIDSLAGGATVDLAGWGILPTLYFDGSAWPPLTLPAGYSGPVVWDSLAYADAPAPPDARDGDRWTRKVS